MIFVFTDGSEYKVLVSEFSAEHAWRAFMHYENKGKDDKDHKTIEELKQDWRISKADRIIEIEHWGEIS